MAEIKPCPFCGDIQYVTHVELSNGLHYIECKRCGAAPHRLGAWDYETAVKYWNSANRWIPCSERLPEREKDVLVYYPRWHDDMFSESGIVVAQLMYDGLTWDICGEFNPGLHAITHWMYLPEPPKE